MKKLQSNYTTTEQSKRLLELGVPANSADCIRVIETNLVFFIPEGRNVEYYIDKYNNERNIKAEPCWSVGQLIEIVRICNSFLNGRTFHLVENMCDSLMALIEIYASGGKMDLSKLKE